MYSIETSRINTPFKDEPMCRQDIKTTRVFHFHFGCIMWAQLLTEREVSVFSSLAKYLKEETIHFMNNKSAELRRRYPDSVTGSLQKQQVFLKGLLIRNRLLLSLLIFVWLIFTKLFTVLMALHIVTFHSEGKYLSVYFLNMLQWCFKVVHV